MEGVGFAAGEASVVEVISMRLVLRRPEWHRIVVPRLEVKVDLLILGHLTH